MKKRVLAVLLMVAIVLPMFPTSLFAAEIIASGKCGENVTWELDSDGVLTISGSGDMMDYKSLERPWGSVKKAVIKNGVTSIGSNAFGNCNSLESITIPDSVTIIESNAFGYCDSLTSITIGNGVTSIGRFAFFACNLLTDVYYTGTEAQWNEIEIESYNDYLTNATIHFNSTGPNTVKGSGSVRLFTSWDAQNQVAYFGEFDFLGCKVTEKTDTSFLANAENLIGKYVWVESEPVGNGMVDSDTLICIKVVETRTGTVSSADATKIIIDGIAYDTPESVTLPGIFVGEIVRYYLSLDGELLELELTDGSGNNDNNNNSNSLTTLATFVDGDGNIYTNMNDGIVGIESYADIGMWGSDTQDPSSAYGINGSCYMEIDLQTNCNIESIWTAHIVVSGRFYKWDAYVTDDNTKTISEWVKVGGKTDDTESTTEGYALTLDTPVNCRYIRLYGMYNSHNLGFHFSEIKVMGTKNDDNNGDNKPTDGKDDDNPDMDLSFNESIYRANYLLSDAPANLDYYVSYVNKFSPSQIFLSSGKLESNAELWRKVTLAFETADDVSSLAEFQFDQSDVYTSILINALEKQTNRINAIDPTAKATVSTVKTITSRVLDILKQTHNLDIAADTDYRNLPAETKKKIQEAFIKTVKDNQFGGALLALGDATKLVSNIMKEVNCIEDFVNQYAMYAGLFEISDSMGTVLKEMYNQTPKTAEYANMRNSIKFCMDMIAETEEEFYNKAINAALFDTFGKTAIKKAISIFYDRFKEKAILSNPELGVILGAYKLSSTVINGLLNVDNIAEKTYKMSVINEYYAVLNGTITSLVLKYNKQPTEQNAEALLNSLELLFGLADIDCDTASSFVNSVDDAFYNKVKDLFSKVGIGNEVNYNSVKNYISSIQKEFSQQCKLSKELWLNQLEADYPGIYKLYVKDDVLVVPITKSYTIKCPVYVYVYDKANNLVAFIDKDRVYAEGNITVSLIGETKIVDFFDNEEYTVVCKGYDTGTMDITVTEYSEGAETRKTVFYELEVSDGASYQTKTNSSENTVMRDNTTISADFDSKLTSETDKHHIVIENGYISGENSIAFEVDAYANAAVEISAYIPDGFVFIGWEITAKDGGIKDRTASTTTLRVPSSDAIVRAIIEPKDKDDIPVSSESSEIVSSSESETSVSPDTEPSNLQNDDIPIIIWIIIPLLAISLSAVLIVIFIKKKKC